MKPRALGQEILTVKEVSELLKIHHSKVYKMTREKRMLPSRSAQTGDFEWT